MSENFIQLQPAIHGSTRLQRDIVVNHFVTYAEARRDGKMVLTSVTDHASGHVGR